MRLPTNDVLAALDATLVHRERLPATILVATDTRTIRPSETFLALRGERYDGHAFVDAAVERGASAAIVEDARASRPSVRYAPSVSGTTSAAVPAGTLRASSTIAADAPRSTAASTNA